MNRDVTEEFEGAIRAELRSQAQQAPGSAATKLAVLAATEGLPMDEPGGGWRRWTVPLLAAAVVLIVAVGLTVSVKVLNGDRSSRPANRPSPTISRLTPPKPVDVSCSAADGETLVDGAQTSFTLSSNGERRYVFEYYCAGSDGHRTGSQLLVYRLENGGLAYANEVPSPQTNFVLSLTGRTDGFEARVAEESPSTDPPVSGAITTVIYDVVDGGVGTDSSSRVVQACRAADLKVALASAKQPNPHLVLQLTNHTKAVCALWGVPSYQPNAGSQFAVRGTLRGAAGGVNLAPSAPVIELQPGQTAGASIEPQPASSCASPGDVRVTLLNGVDLGAVPLRTCGIVAYPLVPKAAGDDAADYPTTPVTASSSAATSPASTSPGNQPVVDCATRSDLLISGHRVSSRSGDAIGYLFTVKLLGAEPCKIGGYPVIRVVDSKGALLQEPPGQPHGFFGGMAAGESTLPILTLSTGQSVSTFVEGEAAAYTPTATCLTNGRIALTLGATTAIPNPMFDRLCGIAVDPWVAGTTGRG